MTRGRMGETRSGTSPLGGKGMDFIPLQIKRLVVK